MNRRIAWLILVPILLSSAVVIELLIPAKAHPAETEVSDNRSGLEHESAGREIIVKFKSSSKMDRFDNTVTREIQPIDELNERLKPKKVEEIFPKVYKLSLSSDADVISIAKEYEGDSNIEYIEPNYVFHTCVVPNDPEYSRQWAHQVIESETAWDIETGSAEVTIAVVDTGVDWNHPDLAANIWNNVDELLDGKDTDGNGYIDDVRGYDFVDTDATVYPGEDGKTRDNDPMDFHGHGTHCAGIAAAVANNSKGTAGVSWRCKIMAVRAGYKGADGVGYLENDDAALAIVYAADNGAHIISMSWGDFEESALICDAVKYAYNKGALLVAAAGNDATSIKHFPAAYDEVVAVTATDRSDYSPQWTNFGNWTELGAPGVDIYSTIPDGSYGEKSGTSMSTPHVAGVAALIWSRFPNITRDRVRRQLWFATDDLGDPSYDEYFGFGRINARKALEMAPPEHDIHMLGLNVPSGVKPGCTAKVKTTIANYGNSDETNVMLTLLINDTIVDSMSISSLTSGSLTTISLTWIPSLEGVYNVTVYTTPVPGETIVSNNVLSTSVVVREAKVFMVPEDFATIQDAVDSAISGIGDTIYVRSGTFHENLVVNKAVSLVGEKRSTTIIEGWVEIRANNVSISSFTFCGSNLVAVYLRLVTGCNVFNNIIANNRDGIYISFSSNNTVFGNNITNNDAIGIGLLSSSENTISENVISNDWAGIYISSSRNNKVFDNNITNNDYGTYLKYCSHNLIYHNNFINNTDHAYTKDSVDDWDRGYPSGGNHWSDYTGVDRFSGSQQNETGSDGIGDTPRLQDDYPLMGLFTAFSLVWEEITYDVDVVSNSSLSDFHLSPSDRLVSFKVTGSDGTIGFCRVKIPRILLGESYTVLVDDLQPLALTETADPTDYYLYFTYSPTTENVKIIGEKAETIAGDTNNDGVVDIFDIVTAALAFGTKPEDPHWNPAADINDDGTVDIYDLVSIVNNFGESA